MYINHYCRSGSRGGILDTTAKLKVVAKNLQGSLLYQNYIFNIWISPSRIFPLWLMHLAITVFKLHYFIYFIILSSMLGTVSFLFIYIVPGKESAYNLVRSHYPLLSILFTSVPLFSLCLEFPLSLLCGEIVFVFQPQAKYLSMKTSSNFSANHSDFIVLHLLLIIMPLHFSCSLKNCLGIIFHCRCNSTKYSQATQRMNRLGCESWQSSQANWALSPALVSSGSRPGCPSFLMRLAEWAGMLLKPSRCKGS